ELAGDGANDRTDKQPDDSEEQTNERTDNCAERAPFCRAEISCAKITPEEIEHVRKKCKQHENDHCLPANALLGAEHDAMDNCSGQNDGRARKNWNDCANQADCEKHDREQPPEEFHLIKILSHG